MYQHETFWKMISEIVGTFVTLAVFSFGILQYKKAQDWKRTEYARALLAMLVSDSDLSLCRILMDWSPRRVQIPQRYVDLMHAEEAKTTFTHGWTELSAALNKSKGFSITEIMYRDVFDTFFTYLEEISHCIKLKLVSCDDVKGIQYWVEKVVRLRAVGSDELVFRRFVETYYPDFSDLMESFRMTWAEKGIAAQVHLRAGNVE